MPKPKLKDQDELKSQIRFLTLREVPHPEPDGDETATGEPDGDEQPQSRVKTFSFSSEEPVERWWGSEILSHEPDCADLSRLNAGSPLLYNHKRDDLLGIIEKAWIGDDKRGYCTVRFSKSERGEWALGEVDDGILINVSFAYDVTRYVVDEKEETYTATRWEPYEVSLVTMPADITIGVGRAENEERKTKITIERTHPETTEPPIIITTPEVKMSENPQKTHDEILAAERSRVKEIDAMCRSHNIDAEKREKMLADGVSIEMARGLVLEEIGKRGGKQSLGNGYAPDLSEPEKRNYSLVKAIRAASQGNWKEAGFEQEVSQDIAKRMNKDTTGFFMPTNLGERGWAGSRAGYEVGGTAGAGTTGGTLVAQNLLAGEFIEVLRNQARVLQAGARTLSGLIGNVTIPRQTSQTEAFWIMENQSVGESEAAFDSVTLSASRTIGTKSLISRNMLLQSTPDIEMLVRADLIRVLALGIDKAALSGDGTIAPRGIANTSGITQIVGGTNGAAIDIDHLIKMEAGLTDANAPEESLAYLFNAKTIGALKLLKSTTGQYLWTDSPTGGRSGTPGSINGYPVLRSNQARKNLTKGTQDGSTAAKFVSELFYGAWSELLFGEWGVLEILPNPFADTAYGAGAVLLRALQTVDIAVRHPQSFAYMNDAIVLP